MPHEGRAETYRVADLVLDVEARLLTRGGELIPLPPKTFELLVELVRRAPGVVRREELMDTVWPKEIVNDEALTQRVMLLRRTLGDDPHHPVYIASVPRWGYRMVAAVEPTAGPTLAGDGERDETGSVATEDRRRPPATAGDTAPAVVRRGSTKRLRAAILAGAGLAAAVAVAAALWLRGVPGAGQVIGSIAVLPFANVTGDPGTDDLCAGLADQLATRLKRIPGLDVRQPQSDGSLTAASDPAGSGRHLNVQAVLAGRVLAGPEQVTVKLDLVDTPSGRLLWSGHFERDAAALPALQTELAASVASRVRPGLDRAARAAVEQGDTDSAAAYRAYLKGRYCWRRRTIDDFQRALEFFSAAAAADSTYARAWAGQADCWALLGCLEYGAVPGRDARVRARSAVLHALQLDDELAEAHATLGLVLWTFDFDWDAGVRQLERAVELDPGYAPAYQWLSEIDAAAGRFDEARRHLGRARNLDPTSLATSSQAATISFYARDYSRSAAEYRQVLEQDPQSPLAHLGLGLALAGAGQCTEALAVLGRVAVSGEPAALTALGSGQGFCRQLVAVRKTRADLVATGRTRFVSAFYLAGLAGLLGERDEAFALLDAAVEERASLLVTIGVEPSFDPVRSDPRFARLLERVGIASYQQPARAPGHSPRQP